MTSQAQSMLNEGVGVLMITNLDSGSAKAIEAQAQAKGVVTIDYDRLTLGGTAQYYVSFDNVAVGKAQGTALTKCAQVQGKSAVKYVEEDGAATDNNATLFKQGYDSVLKRHRRAGPRPATSPATGTTRPAPRSRCSRSCCRALRT